MKVQKITDLFVFLSVCWAVHSPLFALVW